MGYRVGVKNVRRGLGRLRCCKLGRREEGIEGRRNKEGKERGGRKGERRSRKEVRRKEE